MNRTKHLRPLRLGFWVVLVWIANAARVEAEPIEFSRDILPILSDNCFSCHGPDPKTRRGKLRLDDRQAALDREAIVPGKSAESEIIARIESKNADALMPPPKSNKKLSPTQIALLKRWIDEGAVWGKHWSFEKPQRPVVPTFPDAEARQWIRNPIDAFILSRLRKEGLKPSPEATREQLLRRVSLDLTGIPPTPAEIDAFLQDTSTNAYEKVVDRLLASARYGERMAWEWLDAARYADSNGYQGDGERTMWPWRDWVVKAFNANMPFDQFTVEQLAGDLLPNATKEQILATAFNRNHMINGEGGRIPEENRVEYVFDQTETMGTVWLGLTLNCSRCHDHKFDPLTRKDYYQLFAYFNQTPVDGKGRSGQTAPVLDFTTPEQQKAIAAVNKQFTEMAKEITAIEAKLREAGMTKDKDGKYATTLPVLIESALRKGPNDRANQNYDELIKYYQDKEPSYVALLRQFRKLKGERDRLDAQITRVMVMKDMPKPRDTFILTRGAYDKHEGKVTANVPASLPPLPKEAAPNRLALARWLVSADNPLTARVTVNRDWQRFFGTGLVKTTEDFGVQGERPSHPELLDWLAMEFMQPTTTPDAKLHGWNTKHVHRLIVTSATYRQSSKVTPALLDKDPANRLLARGARLRLPSWMLRDQALAVSGLLVDRLGGPAVKPYQPAGIWEEATFGNKSYQQDRGESLYRRSLYVFWRRIIGPTMFFDVANRQTCSVKNTITNTPLHALTTLNDITYVEAARVLAERILLGSASTDEQRLMDAFRRVTARYPSERERAILLSMLDRQRRIYAADPEAARKLVKVGEAPRPEKLDPVEHAAWTAVSNALLNLDEVLSKQ